MRKCLICSEEFEPPLSRWLVCKRCGERCLDVPSQLQTPAERLWGRCYELEGHWEYGMIRPDGRPNPLMLDKRQRSPAQVALFLSGRMQPTPDHIARAICNRPKLCVRPDHLEWAERLTGAALKWGQGLNYEQMADMLQAHRDSRARYQRHYRQKLKHFGVRSIKEVHGHELVNRAIAEVDAARVMDRERERVSAENPSRNDMDLERRARETIAEYDRKLAEAAAPKPSGLAASLASPKIAPVD